MKRILCFGDSNTWGYDSRSFFGEQYPSDIRWTGLLRQSGYEAVNYGQNGMCVPEGAALGWVLNLAKNNRPADAVTVMLGSNDLLRMDRAEEIGARMENLIKGLKEYISSEKILLIAPPEIILTDLSFEASYVQGDRSYAQRYEEEGRELTRLYRELASRRGILFADASAWDLDFAFDAVHLSEKGHAVFGREMIRVMQAVQNGS